MTPSDIPNQRKTETQQLPDTVQPAGVSGAEYRRLWNKLNRQRMRAHSKAYRERHPEKQRKIPRWVVERYRSSGARKRHQKVYYGGWEQCKNRRTKWTSEETNVLLSHSGTDRELSAAIGRSIRAIQIRRSRLRDATDGLVNACHASQGANAK